MKKNLLLLFIINANYVRSMDMNKEEDINYQDACRILQGTNCHNAGIIDQQKIASIANALKKIRSVFITKNLDCIRPVHPPKLFLWNEDNSIQRAHDILLNQFSVQIIKKSKSRKCAEIMFESCIDIAHVKSLLEKSDIKVSESPYANGGTTIEFIESASTYWEFIFKRKLDVFGSGRIKNYYISYDSKKEEITSYKGESENTYEKEQQ